MSSSTGDRARRRVLPAGYARASLAQLVQRDVDAAIASILATTMAQLARRRTGPPSPPPLVWSATFDPAGEITKVTGSVPTNEGLVDVSHILFAWVKALRLVHTGHVKDGMLRYTGVVEGLIVTVEGRRHPAE